MIRVEGAGILHRRFVRIAFIFFMREMDGLGGEPEMM